MKYVIYAPKYDRKSGGIKVLYRLNSELLKRGLDSSILFWGNGLKDKDVCVIYPEIVRGNPLGAKRVIRYVLYFPGANGGDKVYDENEIVFSYSDLYTASIKNKVSGKLFLTTTELELFYDRGLPRDKVCFYLGKSKIRDIRVPRDWEHIYYGYPEKRHELAELLCRSKMLYCFDPHTAVIQEAVLCGCPVVYHGNLAEYGRGEFGTSGMCSNEANIQSAISSLSEVRQRYFELEQEFQKQLDNFIEVTNEII